MTNCGRSHVEHSNKATKYVDLDESFMEDSSENFEDENLEDMHISELISRSE
jgi:predicted house-cleaning noncanonical NTP pyrophosphatase (MazG superfamily)